MAKCLNAFRLTNKKRATHVSFPATKFRNTCYLVVNVLEFNVFVNSVLAGSGFSYYIAIKNMFDLGCL